MDLLRAGSMLHSYILGCLLILALGAACLVLCADCKLHLRIKVTTAHRI